MIREILNKHIAAFDSKEEGQPVIQFQIGKDGLVRCPKIMRSAGKELDEEALRIVNAMPGWSPGIQKGERVAVIYTISIPFRKK